MSIVIVVLTAIAAIIVLIAIVAIIGAAAETYRDPKFYQGTVLDRVRNLVAYQLGIDLEEITPESSFVDDLNADSLDLVDLGMSAEEVFDIGEIKEEDGEKVILVRDAVDLLYAYGAKDEVVTTTTRY